MYHYKTSGEYAKVLGNVNPFGEAPRGEVNGIYEIAEEPQGMIDLSRATLNGVRIVQPNYMPPKSDPEALWQSNRWVIPDTVKARRAREKRNQLLLDSDCVMLENYPLADKTAWKRATARSCEMCRNKRRSPAISLGQQSQQKTEISKNLKLNAHFSHFTCKVTTAMMASV